MREELPGSRRHRYGLALRRLAEEQELAESRRRAANYNRLMSLVETTLDERLNLNW